MRERIIEFGKTKTIVLISLISIVFSVLVYLPIGYFLEESLQFSNIFIVILTSMIVTPSIFWFPVDFFMKLDLQEKQTRSLAIYDNLTSVMSKKAFLMNSKTIYQLSQRAGLSFAVLYIDIDNFKKTNLEYGYKVGDAVLQNLGHVLREHKRESDLLGRVGGEEFVFLLPATQAQGAKSFAQKLQNILSDKVMYYEQINVTYTISIGMAIFDKNNDVDIDTLLSQSCQSSATIPSA